MSNSRDLSFILVGAALAKDTRSRVLAAIGPGMLDKDADSILSAIRDNDVQRVVTWMDARGASIEKGKDAIQAVIDAIVDATRSEKVRCILSTMRSTATVSDVAVIKEVLQDCLAKLEGV